MGLYSYIDLIVQGDNAAGRIPVAHAKLRVRRRCARLKREKERPPLLFVWDWNAFMKRSSEHPSFDRTLELLGAHGFDVVSYAGVAGGALVTKHGVGAVLAPAPESSKAEEAAAVFVVHPGVLVRGEISRLLDRGYQKFIKSSQYELPASASQLQAIHAFSEELKQLTGATSLYNESLGTTSDVYRYDRLMGREDAPPAPAQPWDSESLGNPQSCEKLTSGH